MTAVLEAEPLEKSPAGDLPTIEGCELTDVRLTVKPDGLATEDDWRAALRKLAPLDRGASFWLGDLLAFGESRYGEKYAAAAEETGLSVQTLKNRAWVSRHVPNRRQELSYSCHRLVANIKDEDEQRLWLDRAVEEGWNSAELAKELRAACQKDDDDDFPGPDPDSDFRCPNCEHEWNGAPRP